MINITKRFSSFISDYSPQKGFTLVELVLVFALMAILTITSVASFNAFNKSQTTQSTVHDIVSLLNTAKSRSLSQVKPSQCTTRTLQGYQVTIVVSSSTYQLEVVCGGNTYLIERKTLPSDVTFVSGSTTQVRFAVSSGTLATPATITINGNNNNEVITIDTTGNISAR